MQKKIITILGIIGLQTCGLAQISMDTVYTKTYGNSSYHTEGNSLVELPNDQLLLSTNYQGGESYCDHRPKLYRADGQGNLIWSATGTPGSGRIIPTIDGNFANIREMHTTANCGLDTVMINKFDLNGEVIWTKKFHFGEIYNKATDIIQTADSGFAVSCYYSIDNGWTYNSAVIKLDQNGNTQWTKQYGTVVKQHEIYSIVQNSTGQYGILCFDNQGAQYTLMKLDGSGDTLWTRSFLPPSGMSGYCDLALLPNDQFLILCNGLGGDAVLARINEDGTTDYYREYTPGEEIGTATLGRIMYLPDQNVYLIATNKLFLTDLSGEILWSSDLNYFGIEDVIQLSNDDIVAIGSEYSGTTAKIRLVRFSISGSNPLSVNEPDHTEFTLSPNPFSDKATLVLKNYSGEPCTMNIYTSDGQLVYSKDNITSDNILIERGELTNGIYFFRLQASDKVVTGRLIIE